MTLSALVSDLGMGCLVTYGQAAPSFRGDMTRAHHAVGKMQLRRYGEMMGRDTLIPGLWVADPH